MGVRNAEDDWLLRNVVPSCVVKGIRIGSPQIAAIVGSDKTWKAKESINGCINRLIWRNSVGFVVHLSQHIDHGKAVNIGHNARVIRHFFSEKIVVALLLFAEQVARPQRPQCR